MSARLGYEATAGGLFRAAVHGDQAAVEGSLRAGMSPDIQDDDGDTPLVLAAATGRSGIVDLLLRSGANPDLGGRDGMTPLMMACLSSPIRRDGRRWIWRSSSGNDG
jgi:ankyrin repeat protein